MTVNSFLKYLVLFISLLIPNISKAQFYVTGDDPGRLKWNFIETEHYKIIYPRDNERLAKIYGYNLEKYVPSVSRTSGYTVSGGWNTKMPVVLHTWHGENGSVAWAPKRMDLFTIPTPYSPEPLPWHKMLSIHESRHVTQMQFGMTRSIRPFNWFLGEMINILASLVYPGISIIEGDAVITETAYTPSGRGRVADFLNYYRIAFAEGVDRDWVKWRYGSTKYYTPNHYALGYMALGGFRTFYDCPDFTYRMFELAARRPYRFDAKNAIIKSVSGKKKKFVFKEICDSLNVIWTENADNRATYSLTENISKEPRLYTNYLKTVSTPHGTFVVKSGFLNSPVLMKIDDEGNEKFVRNISNNISYLDYCEKTNSLWWSESTKDSRWQLKSKSIIYRLDIQSNTIKTFKSKRLLHNPAVSSDGSVVSTTQYNPSGYTGITIIDADNGDVKSEYLAPDSLQIVQTVWHGECLYGSAVSDNGYGIYRLDFEENKWEQVLNPQPVMVSNLKNNSEGLTFTSDLDGENEMYLLDLDSGNLIRKSRSRYGLYDYAVSYDNNKVYFSRPALKGKSLVCIECDNLENDTTSFYPQHKYFLAENLTRQEKEFAASKGEEFISTDSVTFSKPKKYGKASHMFNVHSWAPFYVSVNNIMNMSFDKIYQAISLGATGIIQNRLATTTGEFGYSAHKDPFNRSKWRHSAHAKLTYSGFYPVFEGSIDFNDRAARVYKNSAYIQNGRASLSTMSHQTNLPSVQGRISVYLPLSFNSNGWYRGFIPKVTYSLSNDSFDKSYFIHNFDYIPGSDFLKVINGDRSKIMHSLTGSVRFYSSLLTPNSAVYPRFGLGIEAGIHTPFSLGEFVSGTGFGYAYGYLPGITRQQGFKLSALYQRKLDAKKYFVQNVVNTMPRGYKNASILPDFIANRSNWSTKFTFDYAIPIYVGEWPIGGSFIYVKRLVLTPHFDVSLAKGLSLYSAGLSATFDLQTLVWIEWPCSIGVTASVNGTFNKTFDVLKNNIDPNIGRFFVGPVFSVSF